VLDTQILKQAGVENVQAVILALSADSTTLFATVIVKEMAPDVPVIARVNSAENVERIFAAGADFALSISQVSGQLLAWRLLGKESVAVDPELRVVKVTARAGRTPPGRAGDSRDHRLFGGRRERGDDLLVEFGEDFASSGRRDLICGSSEATQKYSEVYPQE
jgi:Trk K+ transport system NAD-binding subunit